MPTNRNNPTTSAVSGRGKGPGVAVPNPGLSVVYSLGDAVGAVTTEGVEVGNYNFLTLFLTNTAGGTVAPEGSPGFEPGSLTNAEAVFAPVANTEVGVGAVTVADLVYTYGGPTTITVPVHGLKIVRFALTGAAADIRYTLHS